MLIVLSPPCGFGWRVEERRRAVGLPPPLRGRAGERGSPPTPWRLHFLYEAGFALRHSSGRPSVPVGSCPKLSTLMERRRVQLGGLRGPLSPALSRKGRGRPTTRRRRAFIGFHLPSARNPGSRASRARRCRAASREGPCRGRPRACARRRGSARARGSASPPFHGRAGRKAG